MTSSNRVRLEKAPFLVCYLKRMAIKTNPDVTTRRNELEGTLFRLLASLTASVVLLTACAQTRSTPPLASSSKQNASPIHAMSQVLQENGDGSTFYASNGSCTFLAGQKNGPAQSCSGQCTNGYMNNGLATATCGGGSPDLFFFNGDGGALDANGNFTGGGGSGFDCSANPADTRCTANCDMYDASCAPSTYSCNPDGIFDNPDVDPPGCGGDGMTCCYLSPNWNPAWFATKGSSPTRSVNNYAYFYFAVNHFWNQKLACHLDGLTQDEFMDQVAAQLRNNPILIGMHLRQYFEEDIDVQITLPSGAVKTVVVRVYTGITFGGDFLINTAFIPGASNC